MMSKWLAVIALAAAVAAGPLLEPGAPINLAWEGAVCDGYDVLCGANGSRWMFHFKAKPKDTLKAVQPLVEARLAALAYDASPEGIKARRLREAEAAVQKASEAAATLAEVKAAYPDEKLPDVTIKEAELEPTP